MVCTGGQVPDKNPGESSKLWGPQLKSSSLFIYGHVKREQN